MPLKSTFIIIGGVSFIIVFQEGEAVGEDVDSEHSDAEPASMSEPIPEVSDGLF